MPAKAARAADSTPAHWSVPAEHVGYDVMYKWGLINKKAGEVTLKTTPSADGSTFQARLTGRTAPWADHFYRVRDTLLGTIDHRTLQPLHYEKATHEGGEFAHDVLTYHRPNQGEVTADVRSWRRGKRQKDTTYVERQHHSQGITLDMLSSFYYMRSLPFQTMKAGQVYKATVLSGKRKELLTIHYVGPEEVKIGKVKRPAYHITFTFTSADGTKTSDNMDAWISATPSRIPLLLEGKLPVGKVRCFYNGAEP